MAAPCRACGRPNDELRDACLYCGALLKAPARCAACGKDIPPNHGKCLYCGAVPGQAAPAAPVQSAPSAPSEPMPEMREHAIGCSPRTVSIILIGVPLLAAAWAIWTFRSFQATWPIASTVAWFVLASRPFSGQTSVISRDGWGSRNYTMTRFFRYRSFRVSVAMVGTSVVAWLVLFIAAFRGDFKSSKWSFLAGFILFASSLLTGYKFKDTRAPVINQDLEAHVQDYGYGLAFLRQYYIWGLVLPFCHACFRLMVK